MAGFTYFIGIDVSRNTLDLAVVRGGRLVLHREIPNEQAAMLEFAISLRELRNFVMTRAVFCLEHTGVYCNHVLSFLKKLKANIVVESALRIKNSSGLVRGKDDRTDSIRIAHYAFVNREHLQLYLIKRKVLLQLASSFALRNRLLATRMALSTPIKEQAAFIKKRHGCRKCEGLPTYACGDNCRFGRTGKADRPVGAVGPKAQAAVSFGDFCTAYWPYHGYSDYYFDKRVPRYS